MGVVLRVGALIAATSGYLCQHRDDNPGIEFSGLWGFFGGHAEIGEETSAALLRELTEELHYDFDASRIFPLFWSPKIVVFRISSDDEEVRRMRLGEGQGMAIIGISDVDRYHFIPGCRALMLADSYARSNLL